MERKRKAERPNSSRGYQGRYLTRRNRTDAKRVYGFCGCHKRAGALLRDSTDLQIRKSQDGSVGVSASCPGPFCPRFYAVRSPFSRAQVKSYYPLCDRRLDALKIGCWISPKCVGWWANLGLSIKFVFHHFSDNAHRCTDYISASIFLMSTIFLRSDLKDSNINWKLLTVINRNGMNDK